MEKLKTGSFFCLLMLYSMRVTGNNFYTCFSDFKSKKVKVLNNDFCIQVIHNLCNRNCIVYVITAMG